MSIMNGNDGKAKKKSYITLTAHIKDLVFEGGVDWVDSCSPNKDSSVGIHS